MSVQADDDVEHIVVSGDTYIAMAGKLYASIEEVPKVALLLDLVPGLSDAQRAELSAELTALQSQYQGVFNVFDRAVYRQSLRPVQRLSALVFRSVIVAGRTV